MKQIFGHTNAGSNYPAYVMAFSYANGKDAGNDISIVVREENCTDARQITIPAVAAREMAQSILKELDGNPNN